MLPPKSKSKFYPFSLAITTIAVLSAALAPYSFASAGDIIDVKGKVALVTGASRGIGAEVAKHLAENGIKVVITARSTGKLNEVKAEIEAAGGSAAAFKVDVTKPEEVKAAYEFATETYGGVDFVFANAGWEGTGKPLEETPDDEILAVTNINIVGYMYAFKYGIPAMLARGGGSIIFTGSVAAIVPRHMAAAAPLIKTVLPYGTSKCANDYMARMGMAYAGDGIRSYGLNPGAFETKMLQNIAESGGQTTQDFTGFNPVKTETVGDPKDLGRVVLSLFDNSTVYEPGTTLVADNDITIPTEAFYEHLHHIKDPESAHGFFQFPNRPGTVRDYRGVPLPPKKEDL
jgi:NAD(P)-dependent dehydrogenase (short-subunit alcohol dehydrogenase family)